MSAILGVFDWNNRPLDELYLRRMLGRMTSRGGNSASVWRAPGAAVAVSRHDWEFGAGLSGPVLVVQDGPYAIAADASLYYRNDLRRRLAAAGVRATGQTPSHLILAAYRAWGERCPEQLEGDFAFIIWDRQLRQILCARDSTGSRSLYYTESGSTLVIASSLSAVAEHPASSSQLNVGAIAIDVAGLLFCVDDRTCREGVLRLQAGFTMRRAASRPLRTFRHWVPKVAPFDVAEPRRASGMDKGAEEFRSLLSEAVAERLDPVNPTAMWLSGGWDSSAVFATGQQTLSADSTGHRLLPVSFSLPHSDRRCENETIAAIADHWKCVPRWVDSDAVSVFGARDEQRIGHEEPWTSPFERLMRAVIRRSRDTSARVSLDGHGGDFLFVGSPIYLADLFVRGRFGALMEEWQALPLKGARSFFKWTVEPHLPSLALSLIAMARGGRRLSGYLERQIPSWMNSECVRTFELERYAGEASPRSPGTNCSAYEMYWSLTQPHCARAVSNMFEFGLHEGMEPRSPLLDRRIIDFASRRPRYERCSRGQKKRLLRHAMRGLLPESVLAPRPFKTGTLAGYLTRSLQSTKPLLLQLSEAPVLASLGIIDAQQFRSAVESYLRRPGSSVTEGQLVTTALAELWARGSSLGQSAPAPVDLVSTAEMRFIA